MFSEREADSPWLEHLWARAVQAWQCWPALNASPTPLQLCGSWVCHPGTWLGGTHWKVKRLPLVSASLKPIANSTESQMGPVYSAAQRGPAQVLLSRLCEFLFPARVGSSPAGYLTCRVGQWLLAAVILAVWCNWQPGAWGSIFLRWLWAVLAAWSSHTAWLSSTLACFCWGWNSISVVLSVACWDEVMYIFLCHLLKSGSEKHWIYLAISV